MNILKMALNFKDVNNLLSLTALNSYIGKSVSFTETQCREVLTVAERLYDVEGLLTGAVVGRCVCWMWTSRVQLLTTKHRGPDQQTSTARTRQRHLTHDTFTLRRRVHRL